MARQGINTGTSPNDGLGDSLLTGAIKINSNFSEIYGTFGNGTDLVSYANTAGGLSGTPSINVYNVGVASAINVGAASTFQKSVHFESTLLIGDTDELQIFHDGNNSYIDNASVGNLIIRDSGTGIQLKKTSGALMGVFNNDAGVELYYDGVLKFQTFQNGVAINESVGIGSTAGNPPYRLTVSGVGATITQGLANAIADFTSSVNGYGQVNVRNSLSGTNASGDVVITANTGTDISNFINLGINNTGFSTSTWTINGALDGYLYTSDGNLSIGAVSASKYVSIFAGGTLAENEQVRVSSTGISVSGISTFNGNLYLGDGNSIQFGNANNFAIVNSGTNTFLSQYVDEFLYITNTGSTEIWVNDSETAARFNKDGSVELYFDNSKKFETTGYGATVFGTLQSQQLNVSGVATITGNLNAAGNYYVKLARTTDQTVATGVDTLIGFTATSDSNGWYSGITTRTTPTVAGTYRVDAMMNWQAGTVTNNQSNIQLRKNGTTFALHQVGITTFSYSQTVCGIVTMNGTTDYIDFTVYTSNPTSQTVRGTADGSWTKMEIFKIN